MDIDKELEALFDDPLLKMSKEEESLFDIPQDMRRVIAKKKADYVAQHKLCENFEDYKPLFAKVHQELKEGRRSLVKINKTATLTAGRYYFISGQMLLLEQIGELKRAATRYLMPGRAVSMKMAQNQTSFCKRYARTWSAMVMPYRNCRKRWTLSSSIIRI